MTAAPCRRCGQVTGNMVLMWRPLPNGALEAYAAQCRAPCGVPKPQPPRPRPPSPIAPPAPFSVVVTAARPGQCASCPRDIQPGDQITSAGASQYVHFECAPASAVPPQDPEREMPDPGSRRQRTRSRPR